MGDLAALVNEINKTAQHYDMREFQKIRKQIHHRARGNLVFPSEPNDEHYVYHRGGRKELQFNIVFEKSGPRFGIAFDLGRAGFFGDPMNLRPKVQRLNKCLEEHPTEFEDMRFWYWDRKDNNGIERKRVTPLTEQFIEASFRHERFLFWGKETSEKDIRAQAQNVLSLFDRLLPVYEYVEGDAKQTPKTNIPQFSPGCNVGPEHAEARSERETRKINLRHNKLTKMLVFILKTKWGENVGYFKTGPRVDVVVDAKNNYSYYEIKTGSDIRICIREALGQLLEYSFWPRGKEADSLTVVTENQMTAEACRYMKTLRERFSLPIYHQRLDVKSKTLGPRS